MHLFMGKTWTIYSCQFDNTGCQFDNTGFRISKTLAQRLSLPVISYLSLGKLHNFSES